MLGASPANEWHSLSVGISVFFSLLLLSLLEKCAAFQESICHVVMTLVNHLISIHKCKCASNKDMFDVNPETCAIVKCRFGFFSALAAHRLVGGRSVSVTFNLELKTTTLSVALFRYLAFSNRRIHASALIHHMNKRNESYLRCSHTRARN